MHDTAFTRGKYISAPEWRSSLDLRWLSGCGEAVCGCAERGERARRALGARDLSARLRVRLSDCCCCISDASLGRRSDLVQAFLGSVLWFTILCYKWRCYYGGEGGQGGSGGAKRRAVG
ncbi:hypothetical protein JB92DRAFT_2827650 [Gautieria morchelliformis]|nr:hypothetical protein JB92DRAFT_2827650 [Gautieria morchelliformis]